MTGAELKVMREALGVSIRWCCYFFKQSELSISERMWRHWETDKGRPPLYLKEDIEQLINIQAQVVNNGVQAALECIRANEVDKIVLYQYKTDLDLWERHPDDTFKKFKLPVAFHSQILFLVKQELAKQGVHAVIDYKL